MRFFNILLPFFIFFGFQQVRSQPMDNEPKLFRVLAVNSVDANLQSTSNETALYLPLSIHVPTAFTPNGDGVNDTFGAVGEGVEGYQLSVFNRWGQLMFSTNTISDKWDGSFRGHTVPNGVYNYELIAYGREFGKVQKTGFITVIN